MSQTPPVFRIAPATAAFVAALLLAACGSEGPAGSPSTGSSPGTADLPMRVGTTLPLFADFAREIGGENVEVFSILPTGADPHTYEPAPSDIRRIAEADIIFVNDLEPGLEGSILDVIANNKGQDAEVIPLMPRVLSLRTEVAASQAGDNPHLWLDPLLARGYADVISEAFISADGIHAAYYGDNLAEYGRRLSQLNDDIAAAVEEIPPENRKLVTSHDAFPHLARRFNLELVGFVVPGPGQEPSSRHIADLTQAIKDRGVPAVFIEPQVGPEGRLLERIAADTGVPACTLYSDTLDGNLPTYIDMMRFNADELLRCLGGGDG